MAIFQRHGHEGISDHVRGYGLAVARDLPAFFRRSGDEQAVSCAGIIDSELAVTVF